MKLLKKYAAASLSLVLLFNLFSCSTEDVTGEVPVSSDPVEIPDAAFAEYLIYLSTPGVYAQDEAGITKYYLIPTEVNGVSELPLSKTASNVTNLQNAGVATAEVKITNLEGIQYFTSLERLVLTSNAVQTLNVSQNTLLKELELNFNLIGSLDLSANTQLTRLRYRGSATATAEQKLSTINLSANTQLRHLYLTYHSFVTINLASNTLINDTLDMTGNPGPDGNVNTGDIVVPAAIYNQVPPATRLGVVSDADVVIPEPELYEITDVAFGEYLIYLGVAGAVAETEGGVTKYYIDQELAAAVTSLNLSKTAAAITTLQNAGVASAATPITSLNGIQHFTGLKSLTLTSNQLTTLDVSALTQLESLQMNFNFVTVLDVSHNPMLKKLRYQAAADATASQKIASINLANNPLLYNINLRRQNLTAFTLDAAVHTNFTTANLLSGDNADEIVIDVRDNPGTPFTIPAAIKTQIQANSTAASPLLGVN